VHHLVSEVQGDLRTECDLVDLLEATFPGGSITGAPKVQAMRTIACLEPTARGLYCGSMGFLAPGGISEWNILIRSIVASRGWLQTSVGGGITARSDPQRELEETWAKARGLVDVLQRPASQR
jgi:para-aminobenzoate synthetase component 1